MKTILLALAVLLLPAFAYAGSCHGTAKTPVVQEEVDVTVKVQEPAPSVLKEKIEVDVVECPTSVVAPPASGLLVRKNARKEKQATIAAAREGRKAARYASKASDAVGQQAREQIVVEAYKAE